LPKTAEPTACNKRGGKYYAQLRPKHEAKMERSGASPKTEDKERHINRGLGGRKRGAEAEKRTLKKGSQYGARENNNVQKNITNMGGKGVGSAKSKKKRREGGKDSLGANGVKNCMSHRRLWEKCH